MRLNTPRFQTSTPMSAQMHLLFKQRGAGRENDNCVGLKLAKKHLCIAWRRIAPTLNTM